MAKEVKSGLCKEKIIEGPLSEVAMSPGSQVLGMGSSEGG